MEYRRIYVSNDDAVFFPRITYIIKMYQRTWLEVFPGQEIFFATQKTKHNFFWKGILYEETLLISNLWKKRIAKKIKKSLLTCVSASKICFVVVTNMIYTLLDSHGPGEHRKNLSGVKLMPLAGDKGIWSRNITFQKHSNPLLFASFSLLNPTKWP